MNTDNQLVLDLRGVKELTTLSQSTIYALAKNGEFPKQKRIGANRVVWLRSEVVAWLEQNLAA